jgi:hypothetical protein
MAGKLGRKLTTLKKRPLGAEQGAWDRNFQQFRLVPKTKKIEFDLEVTNTRLLALLEPADTARNKSLNVREGPRC